MKALLFIDPASVSTGWATLVNGVICEHGTIDVNKKYPANRRLALLRDRYFSLVQQLELAMSQRFGEISEIEFCHIERMNYRVHFLVSWSIGAIVSAISGYGIDCDADISPTAWQKTVDWKGKRGPLRAYINEVQSEDELAAIGMAIHWRETHK